MEARVGGYLTIDEIAHIYCVTKAYAYRLACERHWGRYRHPDGGVRYRSEHADATLRVGVAARKLRRAGKVQD